MTKLWCNLYNFILNIFNNVVEAVAFALSTIGRAVVDVLGDVVEAVGEVIDNVIGGGFPSIIAFVGLGVLAYFLLTKEKDDRPEPNQNQSVARS